MSAIDVYLRVDREPWSSIGVAYRAFYADGVPLYMGAETREELVANIATFLSHRTVRIHGPIPLALDDRGNT